VDPTPLPHFLEVLILEGLPRDFSEVLILVDFKPIVEKEIQRVLEVLILEGLKIDFPEVLILRGLGATNFELRSAFICNYNMESTYASS
jgi:hypothetical protein